MIGGTAAAAPGAAGEEQAGPLLHGLMGGVAGTGRYVNLDPSRSMERSGRAFCQADFTSKSNLSSGAACGGEP